MIHIYGHSDDCVYVERLGGIFGKTEREEYDSCLDDPTTFQIGTDKSGMFVTMRYGQSRHGGGTWSTEVEMIAEGVPVPWDIAWKVEKGEYTGILKIACPTDTPVVRFGDAED